MSDSMAVSGAPSWDRITEDIRCPLCDYNLRGLPEPRCPECGFRFEWPDLLDPARRIHPFVFEHHPERGAWSFTRTLWAGLNPTKFWRSLHPAQPARPRRLVAYLILVASGLLAVNAVHVGTQIVGTASGLRGFRGMLQARLANPDTGPKLAQALKTRYGSVSAGLDAMAPPVLSAAFAKELVAALRRDQLISLLSAVYLLWAPLTLAALLVFRWSMRKARIGPVHVLRCTVYSFDVTVWVSLAYALVATVMAATTMSFTIARDLFDLWVVSVGCALLWMTYRLYVAYKVYLQFDRPFATALASQTIVLLTGINLMLLLVFGL
jgi:hypothetical protein